MLSEDEQVEILSDERDAAMLKVGGYSAWAALSNEAQDALRAEFRAQTMSRLAEEGCQKKIRRSCRYSSGAGAALTS